jgi:hypothetical protein
VAVVAFKVALTKKSTKFGLALFSCYLVLVQVNLSDHRELCSLDLKSKVIFAWHREDLHWSESLFMLPVSQIGRLYLLPPFRNIRCFSFVECI